MIRSVSPLLLGLGLCAASGCASVGVGRGFGLADRMPWNRGATKATAEAGVDDAESPARVAFRAPRRDPRQAAIAEPGNSTFTGHSSVRPPAAITESPPSLASHGDDGLPVIRAGQRTGSSITTTGGNELADDSFEGGTASRVIYSHYRSDRDGMNNRVGRDNPVQLQGLQVVDPSEATQSDVGDPVDDYRSGFTTSGAFQGGRVQPTGAHGAIFSAEPLQSGLEHLIARAEQELAGMSPGTSPEAQADFRRRQVHLRLLYLAAHHPEQALTAIPSLEPADQEYWQQIVWAITNSLDGGAEMSPGERAANTIPPVNTALRRLREQADLSIRNAAFCEEISYFGNYKRFPGDEFVPGQPVLLYAEIENFRSDPTPTGEYRTLLKSVIEIIGPGGQVRGWKKTFAATEDLCRNPRRDYFHNYQFTIPERLPLGPHTLKLTVVDELSGKQATSAIKFMVK
jgi:hypothetical protein